MASVTLDNVVKKFGDVVVVDNVNLEIKDQEFVVLVGPSGCGKTTTLRMIAGLEEISGGSITIGDKVVNNLPPKDRDIAMVFQNYALYPHMSVYDNMAFALKLRKTPKDVIDKKIKAAAKVLDIEHFLSRKTSELSGGQRQRVAIGRAIVREPRVFLMDEPLSNLDAKLRVQMRAEISRLHKQLKITTVYVTHDQIEAMTMAGKIVVMKDGLIQQVDSPQQLYNHPVNRFVASFIGSPPMNFLEGELAEESGRLTFKTASAQLPVADSHQKALRSAGEQALTLGIRPEKFTLSTGTDKTAGRLAAVVDVVEPLGAEQMVYLKTVDGAELLAKVEPELEIAPGQNVSLQPNMERAHYFSRQTEQAIVS